ncbi:unnamed protein product [Prunus armeniaca]
MARPQGLTQGQTPCRNGAHTVRMLTKTGSLPWKIRPSLPSSTARLPNLHTSKAQLNTAPHTSPETTRITKKTQVVETAHAGDA